MYTKIDHIGIAVKSLDSALALYRGLFGLELDAIEEVAGQQTRVAVLPVGESRIELLEATDDASPVARFLARRGEGMHHICFRVEDVAAELGKLRSAGIPLIDDAPRKGAGNCLVAFIHPSGTAGVLVELSQPLSETAKAD